MAKKTTQQINDELKRNRKKEKEIAIKLLKLVSHCGEQIRSDVQNLGIPGFTDVPHTPGAVEYDDVQSLFEELGSVVRERIGIDFDVMAAGLPKAAELEEEYGLVEGEINRDYGGDERERFMNDYYDECEHEVLSYLPLFSIFDLLFNALEGDD